MSEEVLIEHRPSMATCSLMAFRSERTIFGVGISTPLKMLVGCLSYWQCAGTREASRRRSTTCWTLVGTVVSRCTKS